MLSNLLHQTKVQFRYFTQSVKNKFSGYGFFPESAMYNFFDETAQIILPRLKYFRDEVKKDIESENGHIYASWVLEAPELKKMGFAHHLAIDFTREEMDKVNNRWLEILDKMIWAFESLSDYQEFKYDEIKALYPKMPSQEIYELLRKKETEGLELFAKYYRDLWD